MVLEAHKLRTHEPLIGPAHSKLNDCCPRGGGRGGGSLLERGRKLMGSGTLRMLRLVVIVASIKLPHFPAITTISERA